MPNWCTNNFEVYHEDINVLKSFAQAVKDYNLLQTFVPMPKELSDEDLSVHREKDLKLIEKYGHDNLYSWRVENWGTKWDITSSTLYEEHEDNWIVWRDDRWLSRGSFLTAWSPPLPVYEKLTELGFDVHVLYEDKGGGFVGTYDSERGDLKCF